MQNSFSRIEVLEGIKLELDSPSFKILVEQSDNAYFPEFVETHLNNYISFYETNLSKYFKGNRSIFSLKPNEEDLDPIIGNIKKVKEGIVNSIRLVYDGKAVEAGKTFFEALGKVIFPEYSYVGVEKTRTTSLSVKKIDSNYKFYRATFIEDGDFAVNRERLFHVPFQSRNRVNSHRYNTIGTPALYLSESSYVCWEELDRKPINNLYFTKFKVKNDKELDVLAIQKIKDTAFYNTIRSRVFDDSNEDSLNLEIINLIIELIKYLTSFPLIFACTIKVKNRNEVFKPEYIIPQLLIDFVKTHTNNWKGIMYPSTKVNYELLKGVGVYNFVFPINESKETGYCSKLRSIFELKQPVSLEIENLLFNTKHSFIWGNSEINKGASIMLDGISNRSYKYTAFGSIEELLEKIENEFD